MKETDLPARLAMLERQVDSLLGIATRLQALEAAQRSRFELMIFQLTKAMGPDGFERDGFGNTPEFTPMTVTGTSVQLWAGKYELRITVDEHDLHDENEVALDGTSYDGNHRVRVISPTEFAILNEDTSFSAPVFGGGVTVTKQPGAVKLEAVSVENDGGQAGGYVLSTSVWWDLMLSDAVEMSAEAYYLPGGYVVLSPDPLSRDPHKSLYAVARSRCWLVVEP